MNEEENIIQIDDIREQEKKPIPKWKIVFIAVIVLVSVGAILFFGFQTKKVEIVGNTSYTAQECEQAVRKNRLSQNTLAFYLVNKIKSIKTLPFVSSIDVDLLHPSKIRVHINEKNRAGCIETNGKYAYFDKDGTLLEISDRKYKGVPIITGRTYTKLETNAQIPEKKEAVLKKIKKVTALIEKYQLEIDQIYFDQDEKVYLVSGKLYIDLYNEKELDAKVSELVGILKEMKGKEGTISMEYYTKDSTTIIYKPKKS